MTDFLDPLQVLDRTREQTHSLRNLLAGGTAFLVVGGPSAKSLDLTQLRQRGLWSMAVNNMAGLCYTNSFVCADPPLKFHNGIWQDPSVMKFVPIPKLSGRRGHLREKVAGNFQKITRNGKELGVEDCPNVWAFSRRSWLSVDDSFFTEPDAAWGNHNAGCEKTGENKTVCTMFLAIRILYYLGARKIYLVGCDWRMNPAVEAQGNYAFPQVRDEGAIRSNNDQYTIAGDWLCRLEKEGIFKKFGLSIFNCYEYSALRAFPHVPYHLAIQDALYRFPAQPFDLEGWYEKK